jgi:hypothetical protein
MFKMAQPLCNWSAPSTPNGSIRDPRLCNQIHRSLAAAWYTHLMKLNYTNTIAAAFWVLAMCAIGVALGTTSLIGWIVLAGFALLPPLVIARWRNDERSLTECIHDVLR